MKDSFNYKHHRHYIHYMNYTHCMHIHHIQYIHVIPATPYVHVLTSIVRTLLISIWYNLYKRIKESVTIPSCYDWSRSPGSTFLGPGWPLAGHLETLGLSQPRVCCSSSGKEFGQSQTVHQIRICCFDSRSHSDKFSQQTLRHVESLLNLFEVEGSGSRGLLRKACLGMIRNLVHRLDRTFCHEGMQQGSMTDWTTMFPARAGQRKLWMSTFQRQVSHGTFCCVQPEFDHLGQHFKCITWI